METFLWDIFQVSQSFNGVILDKKQQEIFHVFYFYFHYINQWGKVGKLQPSEQRAASSF